MLEILAKSKHRSMCRSCGAPIEWAQLVTGKRIPFDQAIVASGRRRDVSGELIELIDPTVTVTHFATCPQAKQWRRKRT